MAAPWSDHRVYMGPGGPLAALLFFFLFQGRPCILCTGGFTVDRGQVIANRRQITANHPRGGTLIAQWSTRKNFSVFTVNKIWGKSALLKMWVEIMVKLGYPARCTFMVQEWPLAGPLAGMDFNYVCTRWDVEKCFRFCREDIGVASAC